MESSSPLPIKILPSRLTRHQSWQAEKVWKLCSLWSQDGSTLTTILCKCPLSHSSLPPWECLQETLLFFLCYFNICCHYNLKCSLYATYNLVTRSPKSSLSGRAVKHSGKSGTLEQNLDVLTNWEGQTTPMMLCAVNLRERALQNIRGNTGKIKSSLKANIHCHVLRFYALQDSSPSCAYFLFNPGGKAGLNYVSFEL